MTADVTRGTTRAIRSLPSLLDQHSSTARGTDPEQQILLQGGTILSMDDTVGDFATGDVLIVGDRIAEISRSISAPQATVIDATGRIVMPGFCDPHIHCWEGTLGRLIPENIPQTTDDPISGAPTSSRSYMHAAHRLLAPAHRPEDIYAGTLISMLSALDGGITTVVDNMHNARSPEHSDAAVEAMFASGVRGVHALGRPRSGVWAEQLPSDAFRLRDTYFSSDEQLHTMRLYGVGLDDLTELLAVRKELDVWISFDSGVERQPVEQFYRDGLFDGREAFNHANFMSRDQRRSIIDNGGQVNVCPRIETQFRYGEIPYTEWVDQGLRPGISNDNPMTFGIDMFSEMKALYMTQRIDEHRGGPKAASLRDVLRSATQKGADNSGLSDVVGSLTPNKKADIVLLNAGNVRLFPLNNVVSSIVQGADIGSVESVIVNGRIRKWAGQLLGVDIESVRRQVEKSRDYLLDQVAWPHDRIDFDD
ncbi:amidohydrolase family protein [Rhodococcus sp. IEGM 248]|jgi:cytosine/adenosine deaminase-related metal-dependent hydrolase|nr:amidohydrolase family protein [Rhodococcus sp. IEGM 248]